MMRCSITVKIAERKSRILDKLGLEPKSYVLNRIYFEI